MKRNYVPTGIWLPLLSLVALGVAGCGGDPVDSGATESASAGGGSQGGVGGGAGDGGAAAAGTGGTTATGGPATGGGDPGATAATTTAATTTAATTTAATTTTGTGGSTPVSCDYPAGYENGSITWYTLDQGSIEVNCSFEIKGRNPDVVAHVPFGGGQYFAAMNTADYNDAAVCGACVEVSRDDGRKVQAMVVDQCPIGTNPKCKAGHIDLSKNAFLQIGQEQEGYLGTTNGGAVGKISWKYIPCPTTETVSFRLKDATNQYWNEILVEGHTHPIAKVDVEINGTWQTATRQPYNYWLVGDGNMGSPPYHVRATDINGSTVEAMLELKAGAQPASAQLSACE
ncbi:expansin EXLX1 family cellulose-binding protein [Sorangium sp. So ce1036]|uniref:expansin EXLX1 family cellulose-binding protein n=1 Tax=Sorangium sp. So ce1036 TaxID=3133328 RepID=UPI003F042728